MQHKDLHSSNHQKHSFSSSSIDQPGGVPAIGGLTPAEREALREKEAALRAQRTLEELNLQLAKINSQGTLDDDLDSDRDFLDRSDALHFLKDRISMRVDEMGKADRQPQLKDIQLWFDRLLTSGMYDETFLEAEQRLQASIMTSAAGRDQVINNLYQIESGQKEMLNLFQRAVSLAHQPIIRPRQVVPLWGAMGAEVWNAAEDEKWQNELGLLSLSQVNNTGALRISENEGDGSPAGRQPELTSLRASLSKAKGDLMLERRAHAADVQRLLSQVESLTAKVSLQQAKFAQEGAIVRKKLDDHFRLTQPGMATYTPGSTMDAERASGSGGASSQSHGTMSSETNCLLERYCMMEEERRSFRLQALLPVSLESTPSNREAIALYARHEDKVSRRYLGQWSASVTKHEQMMTALATMEVRANKLENSEHALNAQVAELTQTSLHDQEENAILLSQVDELLHEKAVLKKRSRVLEVERSSLIEKLEKHVMRNLAKLGRNPGGQESSDTPEIDSLPLSKSSSTSATWKAELEGLQETLETLKATQPSELSDTTSFVDEDTCSSHSKTSEEEIWESNSCGDDQTDVTAAAESGNSKLPRKSQKKKKPSATSRLAGQKYSKPGRERKSVTSLTPRESSVQDTERSTHQTQNSNISSDLKNISPSSETNSAAKEEASPFLLHPKPISCVDASISANQVLELGMIDQATLTSSLELSVSLEDEKNGLGPGGLHSERLSMLLEDSQGHLRLILAAHASKVRLLREERYRVEQLEQSAAQQQENLRVELDDLREKCDTLLQQLHEQHDAALVTEEQLRKEKESLVEMHTQQVDELEDEILQMHTSYQSSQATMVELKSRIAALREQYSNQAQQWCSLTEALLKVARPYDKEDETLSSEMRHLPSTEELMTEFKEAIASANEFQSDAAEGDDRQFQAVHRVLEGAIVRALECINRGLEEADRFEHRLSELKKENESYLQEFSKQLRTQQDTISTLKASAKDKEHVLSTEIKRLENVVIEQSQHIVEVQKEAEQTEEKLQTLLQEYEEEEKNRKLRHQQLESASLQSFTSAHSPSMAHSSSVASHTLEFDAAAPPLPRSAGGQRGYRQPQLPNSAESHTRSGSVIISPRVKVPVESEGQDPALPPAQSFPLPFIPPMPQPKNAENFPDPIHFTSPRVKYQWKPSGSSNVPSRNVEKDSQAILASLRRPRRKQLKEPPITSNQETTRQEQGNGNQRKEEDREIPAANEGIASMREKVVRNSSNASPLLSHPVDKGPVPPVASPPVSAFVRRGRHPLTEKSVNGGDGHQYDEGNNSATQPPVNTPVAAESEDAKSGQHLVAPAPIVLPPANLPTAHSLLVTMDEEDVPSLTPVHPFVPKALSLHRRVGGQEESDSVDATSAASGPIWSKSNIISKKRDFMKQPSLRPVIASAFFPTHIPAEVSAPPEGLDSCSVQEAKRGDTQESSTGLLKGTSPEKSGTSGPMPVGIDRVSMHVSIPPMDSQSEIPAVSTVSLSHRAAAVTHKPALNTRLSSPPILPLQVPVPTGERQPRPTDLQETLYTLRSPYSKPPEHPRKIWGEASLAQGHRNYDILSLASRHKVADRTLDALLTTRPLPSRFPPILPQ